MSRVSTMAKSPSIESSATNLPVLAEPSMPVLLQQAIAGGNTDLAKDIIGLMRELKHERAKEAFFTAFATISPKLPAIVKSKEVDFVNKGGRRTHYRYADLGAIVEAVKPVLAEVGLSLTFEVTNDMQANTVSVSAALIHSLGYEYRGQPITLPIVADVMNQAQAVGSAQTYGQRYTAMAILGLGAKEDDDAAVTNVVPKITDEQRSELDLLWGLWAPRDDQAAAFDRRYGSIKDMRADKFAEAKKFLEGRVTK